MTIKYMTKHLLKLLTVALLLTTNLHTSIPITHADSSQQKPYVTVVNQIRGPQLGLEGRDLQESLKAQHQSTTQEGIKATWLWTYSALEDTALTNYAKKEMNSDEHGLFLEIDPNTAEKNGIRYRGKHQWYHTDGLFLTSYDIWEREQLIQGFLKNLK
jgi:hypothetical protein